MTALGMASLHVVLCPEYTLEVAIRRTHTCAHGLSAASLGTVDPAPAHPHAGSTAEESRKPIGGSHKSHTRAAAFHCQARIPSARFHPSISNLPSSGLRVCVLRHPPLVGTSAPRPLSPTPTLPSHHHHTAPTIIPHRLLRAPPRRDALYLLPRQAPRRPAPGHPLPPPRPGCHPLLLRAPLLLHLARPPRAGYIHSLPPPMPRALQRSGSNSLASLLRAEPADDFVAAAVADPKLGDRDNVRHRGSRARRRSCLRLPLGAADGCRVCDCDEMDSAAPAAAPRRRPSGNDEEEEDDDDGAVQCFSWKKGAAAAAVPHRASGASGDAVALKEEQEATSLAELPDDVTEMVLGRLPLASLLAARCVCRRWRDLTISPQFLRMRRDEHPAPRRAPWLFLFGVDAGDVGWGAAPTPAVHALDVDARRWRRVGAAGLNGRFLFSVAGVGDDLYVVGGRSGGCGSDATEVRTHKGVLVFSPLTGLWRKAAPMRTARSRPVLGVFEMSATCSILHARAAAEKEKHVRRGKSRLGGGAGAVYEDPHRLSLRRLRLKDMLNDDTDSMDLALSHGNSDGHESEEGQQQPRLAIVAVGGRGHWDEPLVSGEIYDPLIDRWVEIAGFPADVGLACSGAVCGRVFYVYCESDTLVAYHLDRGTWAVVQTSRPPPPRLRDYAPTLACCASRLFMLCVSWCGDRHGPAVSRRGEKVVRKVFELDLASLQWAEVSAHPDAPMDPNAAFAAGRDRIYAVEMFRIFGKVLDFVTACRVSDAEQRWSRIGRENAATEADAMSCRMKSMAIGEVMQPCAEAMRLEPSMANTALRCAAPIGSSQLFGA
nr:unnamed protein product [Digitaria exilis]